MFLLVLIQNGKQFTKKQLGFAMTEFKHQHDIKEKWMYFDLRHSFARNFLDDGGTMADLQKILGIRNIETAREVYGYQPSNKLTAKSPFED
jgi:site-specific recombinase XerD